MRKYRMSQKMPEKWFHIKLGEFLTELRERNKSNNHNAKSVLSVTNKSGFVISEEFFERKVFSKDLSNYKIVRKGQFAYNPSRVNVGSIARLKKIDSGLLSPMYFVFETKKGLHGTYLDHWISSQRFRNLVKANTQGTVRDSLNFSALAGFPFILPPLPEQRKIADILSSIDTLIEKTQAVINQTQTLKKALMQELFTRGIPGRHKKFKKTELGRIPEEWKAARIMEVAKIRYGLGQPPQLDEKGVPMIRATDIKDGKIDVENLQKVDRKAIPQFKDVYLKKNDLLVVRSGAYTGDIGFVNRTCEGFVAGYDLVVRPNQSIESKYLLYYLLSPTIQKGYFQVNKSRSAQPHLNAKEVGETKIPLPLLSEQKEIAKIISLIDRIIEVESCTIEQCIELKLALMQVLLTGEARVKVKM